MYHPFYKYFSDISWASNCLLNIFLCSCFFLEMFRILIILLVNFLFIEKMFSLWFSRGREKTCVRPFSDIWKVMHQFPFFRLPHAVCHCCKSSWTSCYICAREWCSLLSLSLFLYIRPLDSSKYMALTTVSWQFSSKGFYVSSKSQKLFFFFFLSSTSAGSEDFEWHKSTREFSSS